MSHNHDDNLFHRCVSVHAAPDLVRSRVYCGFLFAGGSLPLADNSPPCRYVTTLISSC
jgi:hypothetical protein